MHQYKRLIFLKIRITKKKLFFFSDGIKNAKSLDSWNIYNIYTFNTQALDCDII